MALGQRIRERREQLGWDQQKLSRESGVPSATISALETRDSKRSEFGMALAHALGLRPEWAQTGEGPQLANVVRKNAVQESSNVEEGPTLRKARLVPVKGRAMGGDNGFFEVESHDCIDGWLEVRTPDAEAFGLRVVGDSMAPRYQHGEFALAEPSMAAEVGDDVYVALHDGRKMLKRLGSLRDDAYTFYSVNDKHPPITVQQAEVQAIYPASPVTRRAFVRATQ